MAVAVASLASLVFRGSAHHIEDGEGDGGEAVDGALVGDAEEAGRGAHGWLCGARRGWARRGAELEPTCALGLGQAGWRITDKVALLNGQRIFLSRYS